MARTIGDLPDALLSEILGNVSSRVTRTGLFKHGLVCKKWNSVASTSPFFFQASIRHWKPTETDIMDEMSHFPAITALKVTSVENLSDAFLDFLARHCRTLTALEVNKYVPCSFSPEAWSRFLHSCTSLASLQFSCFEQACVAAASKLTDLCTVYKGQDADPESLLASAAFIPGLCCLKLEQGRGFPSSILPNATWQLTQLKVLRIEINNGGFSRRRSREDTWLLPPQVTQLKELRTLHVGAHVRARFRLALPECFGFMGSLRSLGIHCAVLSNWPESMRLLSQLRVLSIKGEADCNIDLQGLNHLQRVNLNISSSSRPAGSSHPAGVLSSLQHLTHLSQTACPASLAELQGCQVSAIRSLSMYTYCQDGACRAADTCTQAPTSISEVGVPCFKNVTHVRAYGPAADEVLVHTECFPSLESLCINQSRGWQLSLLPELPSLGFLSLVGSTEDLWLPETFGSLTSLTKLSFQHLSNLRNLPPSIGDLSNLRQLSLGGAKHLSVIPSTIGQLSLLEEVLFCNLPLLPELPRTLCQLECLTRLTLNNIDLLEHIPLPTGAGPQLKVLEVMYCKSLKELPEDLGSVQNLRELKVYGCERFGSLPESIGKLQLLGAN